AARSPAPKFESRPRSHQYRRVHRHLALTGARRQIGAADGDQCRIVEPETRSDEGQFQCGFRFGIADENVGDTVRPLIHHAVDDDAITLITETAQVLQRRQSTWFDDMDVHPLFSRMALNCSTETGTNRTLSPGCSRQGGSVSGVNNRSGVRPRMFHPPGVSIE